MAITIRISNQYIKMHTYEHTDQLLTSCSLSFEAFNLIPFCFLEVIIIQSTYLYNWTIDHVKSRETWKIQLLQNNVVLQYYWFRHIYILWSHTYIMVQNGWMTEFTINNFRHFGQKIVYFPRRDIFYCLISGLLINKHHYIKDFNTPIYIWLT